MIFVLLSLLSSSILWWLTLITKNRLIWANQVAITLVVGSNFYLFWFPGSRWFQNGYFPLSNLYESLVFLCWCLTTVSLIVSQKTSSRLIGSILTPMEALVAGFAAFLPHEMQVPASLVPALQSNWLMLHVSMMIASYATLILGSLLAILLLVFSFRKSKSSLADTQYSFAFESNSVSSLNLNRFPVGDLLLSNLDTWSYRVIGLGYIALTVGIIAGAVWANESWGSYWSWDPKETWSLITWLIFTAYLHARLVKNWSGREAAIIGAVGFISIWISYLGVNFLASGLHSYGWIK